MDAIDNLMILNNLFGFSQNQIFPKKIYENG